MSLTAKLDSLRALSIASCGSANVIFDVQCLSRNETFLSVPQVSLGYRSCAHLVIAMFSPVSLGALLSETADWHRFPCQGVARLARHVYYCCAVPFMGARNL